MQRRTVEFFIAVSDKRRHTGVRKHALEIRRVWKRQLREGPWPHPAAGIGGSTPGNFWSTSCIFVHFEENLPQRHCYDVAYHEFIGGDITLTSNTGESDHVAPTTSAVQLAIIFVFYVN